MTCIHVRLLGPCFKTGQADHACFRLQYWTMPSTHTDNQYRQHTTIARPYIISTRLVRITDRIKCLFAFKNRKNSRKPRLKPTRICRLSVPKLSFQFHATRMTRRNATHYQRNKSYKSVSSRMNNLTRTISPQYQVWISRQYLQVLPAYPREVSRTIELSLQSSFQLSLTVLVRYRSRGHI